MFYLTPARRPALDGFQLMPVPADLGALLPIYLSDKVLEEDDAHELAAKLEALQNKFWIVHVCNDCDGSAATSVLVVHVRKRTVFLQRHPDFRVESQDCAVERWFGGAPRVLKLKEYVHVDPPGPVEGTGGQGGDGTAGPAGDAGRWFEDVKGRRPYTALALCEIRTCLTDAEALELSAGGRARAGQSDEAGDPRHSGQRILFSMMLHSRLHVVDPDSTRESQRRALLAMAHRGAGDSLDLSHVVIDGADLQDSLAACAKAAKAKLPNGKRPIVYYIGAVRDVVHTAIDETTVLVDSPGEVVSVTLPLFVPKVAREADCARAPYAMLLAATLDEEGELQWLFGYAHPIFSLTCWVIVDSDEERETISLSMLEMLLFPQPARETVEMEKCLFPIEGSGKVYILPDFIVRRSSAAILCLIETAGSKDPAYLMRKAESHSVMRKTAKLLKHRAARRPRELSDRVFVLGLRKVLAEHFPPYDILVEVGQPQGDLPPAIRERVSFVRWLRSGFTRLRSWAQKHRDERRLAG